MIRSKKTREVAPEVESERNAIFGKFAKTFEEIAEWNSNAKEWNLAHPEHKISFRDLNCQPVMEDMANTVRLCTSFEDKDIVKALGAKWSKDNSCWYVPAGTDLEPFLPWIKWRTGRFEVTAEEYAQAQAERDAIFSKQPETAEEVVEWNSKASEWNKSGKGHPVLFMDMDYKMVMESMAGTKPLDVPFKEKDAAKALGAEWVGRWVVPAGMDLAPFAKWIK